MEKKPEDANDIWDYIVAYRDQGFEDLGFKGLEPGSWGFWVRGVAFWGCRVWDL